MPPLTEAARGLYREAGFQVVSQTFMPADPEEDDTMLCRFDQFDE